MNGATVTKPDWWSATKVYFTPRMLIILAMGFASGLPLLLTLSTLSYWLSKNGVDRTTIGIFALVGTPYTFKFVWSPLLDHLPIPFLTKRMGRRRSWLFVLQILLAGAIFAMGLTDPAVDPVSTAIAAVVVAFLSASQDVVIDAYRIEFLTETEQGAGAGATQTGYRFGLWIAGAVALAMSDFVAWPVVFAFLSILILASAFVTLLAAEPNVQSLPKHQNYAEWINDAVVLPFANFMSRRGWVVILAFVLFYKFGDALGGTMATPFYNEMGFTGLEIGAISKTWGIWMTVIGALIGGVAVARWGVFRALLIGGILQAATNLTFSYVALQGHDLYALAAAITMDNLAGGAAGTALVAYLSGLCNVAYTATQYALLTSFMAYGRTLMSSGSGWLSEQMDWASFWAVTMVLAVPGLLLLFWIMRLYPAGAFVQSKA